MNQEEMTRFRLESLEKKLEQMKAWQDETQVHLTTAIATLTELTENSKENKKTLKSIFASVIIGVTMLFITTIIAKIT
jgi:hypothetical protein